MVSIIIADLNKQIGKQNVYGRPKLWHTHTDSKPDKKGQYKASRRDREKIM